MELDYDLFGLEFLPLGRVLLCDSRIRRVFLSPESDSSCDQVVVLRCTCKEARRSEGEEPTQEEETQ